MNKVTVWDFPWLFIKNYVILTWNTVKWVLTIILNIVNYSIGLLEKLIKFLGPVAGSVAGQINEEELYKVIQLATTVGGGFWGFVEYLHQNADKFITDPQLLNYVNSVLASQAHNYAAIILFTVVFVVDLFRRTYHDKSLVKTDQLSFEEKTKPEVKEKINIYGNEVDIASPTKLDP